MATGHDHFEELAVGHVLGGLGASDAARFRSHLAGCRDCRARVAELRDLASELAAVERDELAQARVKTEVARRNDGALRPEPAWRISLTAMSVTVVVALVASLALAFWNFHLRDQRSQLLDVAEAREAILEGLATGTPVPTERSGGVTGLVVVDATEVTVDLAGLPAVTADQRLVVWLLADDPADHAWWRFGPDELPQGRLALRDPHRGADRLVITVEAADAGGEPAGRELVSADLPGKRSTDR